VTEYRELKCVCVSFYSILAVSNIQFTGTLDMSRKTFIYLTRVGNCKQSIYHSSILFTGKHSANITHDDKHYL